MQVVIKNKKTGKYVTKDPTGQIMKEVDNINKTRIFTTSAKAKTFLINFFKYRDPKELENYEIIEVYIKEKLD